MFLLFTSLALADIPPSPPAPTPAPAAEGAAAADGTAVADAEVELPPELKALLALEAGLTYEHGDVVLGGGKAVLHVPETFGYLDAAETDRVLQSWGNPPDPNTWGMLAPTGVSLLADESWAVIVSYSDDGHIADDDAADIDYAEILTDMQAGAAEESAARVQAGLTGVRIVGWAEQPHYDPTTHKIYWAKELDFGQDGRTLNYAIRALGRSGVLEFNAVAPMEQLPTIKAPMEQILGFAEFTAGNRYEEFDASVDHTAEYGLAALVAGGVAAKTGVFKGLLLMLLAGKKFVVIGVVALIAGARALFGKKDQPKS